MAEDKYFVDDRVIIPDDIKKMSKEQLQETIKMLEEELNLKKKSA